MHSLCPVICQFLIVVLSSVILAVQSLKECYRKQCAAHFFLCIHLRWISVCAASMCTFSCKCNVILIWANSCLSPSMTLSAKRSHFILLRNYEDRDIGKRQQLTWLMQNLWLHWQNCCPEWDGDTKDHYSVLMFVIHCDSNQTTGMLKIFSSGDVSFYTS